MASIQFGADELKPLIEQVVREVMATIGTGGSRRLAYTEDEAAALLGLHPKQLAEARRLGKVRSFRVGKTGVRYSRRALDRFIEKAEGELG